MRKKSLVKTEIFFCRACNKDLELEIDGKKIVIEKGRSFYVSVSGIHYDSKYYPNPENFDPERFNEENRGKIEPGTYLPFGKSISKQEKKYHELNRNQLGSIKSFFLQESVQGRIKY